MLKIWGRTSSSNVMKVLWACRELGVPFDRVDAGGSFGKTDSPEYRAMNPNGLVPTIEDDGFVLWESNACVRYLAAKHGDGGLWPSDPRQRADADRWMDWQQTTLGPAFTPIFFQLVRTPEPQRDLKAVSAAAEKTGQLLRVLEERLGRQDCIAGSRLTVGDIPYGPLLHRWFQLPFDKPSLPKVEAWYRRMRERPGFAEYVSGIPIT